jgi:uncharacterized membrane protein YccF (DUF307 family)
MTAPNASLPHVERTGEPGCLIQVLWFAFVGWWLGSLAIAVAWVLNVTIIGLPLGLAILNNIPKLLALQNPERYVQVVSKEGRTVIRESDLPEHPFLLRALFFLLIGWWWSGIWLSIAFALCATIILLPVGLPMFRATPAMTTLARY